MQSIFSCRRMMAGIVRATRPVVYNAYQFGTPSDGNTGFISVTAAFGFFSPSQYITALLWTRPTDVSVDSRVFRVAGSGGRFQCYLTDANTLTVEISDGLNVDTCTFSVSLVLNTLYKIAVVYDGTLAQADRLKCYIDDVAQSLSSAGPTDTNFTLGGSDRNMRLGEGLVGDIREVRVWSTALTSGGLTAETLSVNPSVAPQRYVFGGASPVNSGSLGSAYDGVIVGTVTRVTL